ELEAICREHLEPIGSSSAKAQAMRTDLTDQQIIAKASQCRNGHKFRALFFDGNRSAFGDDDSRADQALVSFLAYFCGPDSERIIRLMRQSALAREKWNRLDYLQRTVAAVLAKQQRFYKPSNPNLSHLLCNVHSGGSVHIQSKCDNLPTCPI